MLKKRIPWATAGVWDWCSWRMTHLQEGRKGCTQWSMELGEKERPGEGKRKAMLYDESKNCWELEK